MNAKFARFLYTHHSINEKANLNSVDLCFANGGGGGCKYRLCTLYHSLNFNFSLKIQQFKFSFKKGACCLIRHCEQNFYFVWQPIKSNNALSNKLLRFDFVKSRNNGKNTHFTDIFINLTRFFTQNATHFIFYPQIFAQQTLPKEYR